MIGASRIASRRAAMASSGFPCCDSPAEADVRFCIIRARAGLPRGERRWPRRAFPYATCPRAKVHVSLGIARFELDRLAIPRDRLVQLAECCQRRSRGRYGLLRYPAEPDRVAESGDRLVVLSLFRSAGATCMWAWASPGLSLIASRNAVMASSSFPCRVSACRGRSEPERRRVLA